MDSLSYGSATDRLVLSLLLVKSLGVKLFHIEVDMARPILHPALQFHAGAQPHEVLHWDLTQPWSFKKFATMAWIHTLFPEEELTPVSHPPLPYIFVAFDILPGLTITITASTRGGLLLSEVSVDLPLWHYI
jgi:hypothetical protein